MNGRQFAIARIYCILVIDKDVSKAGALAAGPPCEFF